MIEYREMGEVGKNSWVVVVNININENLEETTKQGAVPKLWVFGVGLRGSGDPEEVCSRWGGGEEQQGGCSQHQQLQES